MSVVGLPDHEKALAMSDRLAITAVLYPLCQSVLFGTGLIAVAVLAPGLSDIGVSIARTCIASLVLAAPLSWALAPVLASDKERAGMQ